MAFIDETWWLRRGEESVGEIRVTEADFPWPHGDFLRGPGRPAAEPGFTGSRRPTRSEEWEQWDRAWTALEEEHTLHSPEGPVAEFLLPVEPPHAWFRFSEEPFDLG
ncbi:hypothetical protein [Kitasatospora cheerisanensis]|uniref:Uncharacterized protein n=1 Tax=Kitasatospora cheerisanensis KCTC 2395 TaxID=1348663 RepID=A0A066Z0S3_9ACTN|nr:hypothetical protein [Kitasatospora cheerisanensis]KDN83946.1 hypothetical protein KCH_45950 [Kitasatospora cheerisanensis KCTC 2395]